MSASHTGGRRRRKRPSEAVSDWFAENPREAWARALAQTDLAPQTERVRQREAIELFRGLLGNEWDGWRRVFPLAHTFWFASGEHPSLGAVLARQVRLATRDDPAQGTARARTLGTPERAKFDATSLELEAFEVFAELGHRPRFVPETPGKGRCADLRVTLDGGEIALELKRLQPAADESAVWAIAARLTALSEELGWRRTSDGVVARGRLMVRFEPVLGREALGRWAELDAAARKLASSDGGEVVLPGLWAVAYTPGLEPIPGGCENLPLSDRAESFDRIAEVRRILGHLEDNGEQLAGDRPGILVIRSRNLLRLSWEDGLKDAAAAAAVFGADITDHPDVAALVVVEGLGNTGERGDVAFAEEHHHLWSVGDAQRRRRHSGLMVVNPGARHPLREREVEALLGAVRRL